MRAISVLSLDTGTSTRWCLAAAALRMRVKKSAMGSVCIFLLTPLPACFHDAWYFSLECHAAKTNSAHLKLADIRAGAAANATAVPHTYFELGLLERLSNFRRACHLLGSPGVRSGRPKPLSNSRPSSSFFAVVVMVMF